ncbi:MAG: RagB/SusD family nutrient uptake outer membrane protein [Marinilabiliaceae bacterium]|nr:RagB/SusD family nutrient uptake outer membrane protein [Marinilabiliaceae bacterium]
MLKQVAMFTNQCLKAGEGVPSLVGAIVSILALLTLGGCEERITEKRSQRFYEERFSWEALSTDNADTLYERAYQNFAVTSNDPTALGAVWQDSNIKNGAAETTSFIRSLFTLNEMPTDELLCAWDDGGIAKLNLNQWDEVEGNLKVSEGLYLRLLTGVMLCNKYIHLYGSVEPIKKAEMRFLRALNYYYLLDIFKRAPIFRSYLEDEVIISDSYELYSFIYDELSSILPILPEGKVCFDYDERYGKANRSAVQLLMARLCLNSEVYTGEPRWKEAANLASILMKGPYRLCTTGISRNGFEYDWSAYQLLFVADNGVNGAQEEFIFPIKYDSDISADWNGTTYIVASASASTSTSENALVDFLEGLGIKDAWVGNRAMPSLVMKFLPQAENVDCSVDSLVLLAQDDRALFLSKNRRLSCTDRQVFEDGFSVMKFCNLYSSQPQPAELPTMASIDFPLMRLGEAYLTYAEAMWRMGNDKEALSAINVLRQRAHASPLEIIDKDGEVILDEWSREFYFEGRRRTDLIRFGRFGGQNDYTWQWQGGNILGKPFSARLNYYTLPIDSLIGSESPKEYDAMYYLVGDGIGDGTWRTSGGNNIGVAIVPMSSPVGGLLRYTDYFTKESAFKLFRDFDSWDEQYGLGDYNEVKHNDAGSDHFRVESEGLYSIVLDTKRETVRIEPVEEEVESYESLQLTANRGKVSMRRYSEGNKKTHVWLADIDACGGEIVISIGEAKSHGNSFDMRGTKCHGLLSHIDDKGRIVVTPNEGAQKVRVIYNDIDKALYTFAVEQEMPKGYLLASDVEMTLSLSGETVSEEGGEYYVLDYAYSLPKLAKMSDLKLGLAEVDGVLPKVFFSDFEDRNGKLYVHKSQTEWASTMIGSELTHFVVELDFQMYGELWKSVALSESVFLERGGDEPLRAKLKRMNQ